MFDVCDVIGRRYIHTYTREELRDGCTTLLLRLAMRGNIVTDYVKNRPTTRLTV